MASPTALFVSYTAGVGGAERLLLDQALGLEPPVALACPEGPLAHEARQAGLVVLPLQERRLEARTRISTRIAASWSLAAQARELRRAVAELAPRCVIAWNMRAALSASIALAGVRRSPPFVFQHNDFAPSPAVAAAVRAAASRADSIVVPSRAVASDLGARGRAEIEVIHPGVDLDRFATTPLPGEGPEVLVLGAIVGWKRPDLALETVALARRDLPGLRLQLAGAPVAGSGARLLADLRARAAEPDLAGSVTLTGKVQQPETALSGATCLLHCADREPFGLALVEAIACGRPVAAPRAGGPQEILDGSCGRLFEPGDPVAAATALREVATRAAELSGAARDRAVQHFDVATSRARFRNVVEAVLR